MSNRRKKPYYTEDFPFGQNFNSLTFASEKCSNSKCSCNRKQNEVCKDTDILNFANFSDTFAQSSEERKSLMRDARLKLHHKTKDHKTVLKEAKLKLNHKWLGKASLFTPILTEWGTLTNKRNMFGSDSCTDITSENSAAKGNAKTFKSLAKDRCDSKLMTYDHSGASFTYHQQSSSSQSDSSEDENSNSNTFATRYECSRVSSAESQMRSLGIGGQACSCADQAARVQDMAPDYSVEELASYLEDYLYLPKKMSPMAEMMYT